MHMWGDDDFDWRGLGDCVNWFPKQLHRYARFNLTSCKEKYGTMRLEWVGMCHHGIYGLIYPGRLIANFSWPYYWVKTKTVKIGSRDFQFGGYYRSIWDLLNETSKLIASKTRLCRLWWTYQRFVFNLVTLRASQKWPHLIPEITADYEFQRWLYAWVKQKIGYEDHWRSV